MKKIIRIVMGVGLAVLMLSVGRVEAACTGYTKCGVKDLDNNCPGDAYTTDNCLPSGDACVAKDCGGGAGCAKGDTCDAAGSGEYDCSGAVWPACGGWCPEGTVCQSGASAPCACRTPRTCAEVLGKPNHTVTRLTPTGTSTATTATALVSWPKPAHDYVTRLTLVVADLSAGIGPWHNDCTGEWAQYCVVNERSINPQVTLEYLVTGLIPGKWYNVWTEVYADDAPGWMSACFASSQSEYLSSCRMTPNPLTIEVGGTGTLQTEAVEQQGNVVYESSATNIATVTSPDLMYPYSTTVQGVGQGTVTVTNRARVLTTIYCEDTATVYVGEEPPDPGAGAPWWQVVGGGVYAGGSSGGLAIRSEVPAGQYLLVPGTVGSVAALMRSSGTYETGSGELSVSAWNALTQYRGKRVGYALFAAQLGVGSSQANDFATDVMDKPVNDPNKEFYYLNPSGASAAIGNNWQVESGEKYVILVDGDLTIEENITVANGGYLMFVVKGGVTVDPSVTQMEGIYVIEGWLTTETVGGGGDTQLVVSGSVVAWDGVNLNRDLGVAGNDSPAEQFIYRPDLLEVMPKKVKTFVMEWQEVAPGTFGN